MWSEGEDSGISPACTVMLEGDVLVDGEGQGTDELLTAWDAKSGRILWTNTAAEKGTKIEIWKIVKKMRWYRERFRNDLWRLMWVERSREMAGMVAGD
mmetsp:Transcript_33032/g.44739  ORF Transcript_33032/g.44739 Transcript_33032/m.44739 type:complete len:98 (+) Transcript_33032:636-929(+)